MNVNNTFLLGDIVGARIVCNFISDVYDVIEKIKSKKEINILEEKDYIKNPKKSGYRGYHIIISIPITINGIKKDINSEIQIRTNAMDFWATNEHILNYKKTGLSINDKKDLKNIANEVWKIDLIMNEMFNKQRINKLIINEKTSKDLNILINNVINFNKRVEIYNLERDDNLC